MTFPRGRSDTGDVPGLRRAERKERRPMWDLVLNEDGQSTVEYVLVVLAAAALAMALVGWIGGSSLIPSFFSSVMNKVIGFVR